MATQKISEMTEAIILQDEDYVPIVQSELNKKIKIEYLRDYNKLHNKPTLNGVTIENNKKLSDYNVVKANQGIKVNSSTKQTLELEVPTNQELEQRSDVNKAITIATADKMAKETAHQTMSKEYQPNSQDKLKEGEKQPVSYKAVKDYVDVLENKVDENERDIEAKVTALDQKTSQKDEELKELINTNEQDIEQKVDTIEANIDNLNNKDNEIINIINYGGKTSNGNEYHGESSDYGIEIGKVSGNYEQVTTNGCQLFDASKLSTKTQGGVTVTNNGDGSFTISGSGNLTSVFSHSYTYTKEEALKLIKAGTLYGVAEMVSNPYYIFGIYNKSDSTSIRAVSNSNNKTASATIVEDYISKINDGIYELRIYFYGISGRAITSGTIRPMVYQDGDGTWEPFSGGKPSPNPDYAQEPKFFEPTKFVSHSKNLLDNDNIANYFDRNYGSYNGYKIKDLKPNTKYTMSTNVPKSEISTLYFGGIITGINGVFVNIPKTMSTNKNGEIDFYIRTDNLSGYKLDDFVNGKYYIQLEEGEVATSYAKYCGKSAIPTDITLRALPNDVCDTYENGVITRRVGKVFFDGSDDESWVYNATLTNTYQFSININANGLNGANGISNCFEFKDNYNDNEHIKVASNGYIYLHISKDRLNGRTIDDLKTWLYSNPIDVYYELSTPTTEYYSFPVIPSYFNYTNAWHDSEVEANDLTWFINTYARNSEYTDEFLQKFFALQRTGKVYTVRFPLFSKSTSPTGEKLDNNAGLTCEPSTDTIIGQDDYQDIPLFKTYDVNAYVDDNGRIHVTAFKGDKYFKDMGKVDVFVLGMSYYEKYWEDDNYWYYSRTDMPRDGYTLCAECRNTDGSESSYALYSKYVSGEIDGKPYSSKGLIPKRNISYNTCESYYHSRGKNYGGSPMYLYKYLMTTFYLKYATLNTQSKIYGCFNYSYQYAASMAENNVKRIVLTTAQAANIVVGSYVSIGDKGSNSSVDRSNSYMHNKAEEVEVISKTTVDDSHVAINVDSLTSFNTTTTTYLSTMHWKSGFSDNVLGRDGSIGDLTSGKYPMVFQGIELAVGGYEVAGNAFMDIVSSTGKRNIYVTNDNSKITTTVADAKSMYNKSKNSSQPTTLSAWNYITKMALDEENGMFNVIECGNSGSGSVTGFCDGFYVDSGTSGQREFLLLGCLWDAAFSGLSCVRAFASLSAAYWYFLARLSISGRKG